MFITKAKLKNVALGPKLISDMLLKFFRSPRHSAKPHVGSRISSPNIKERLKPTDKYWSEMSGWEKIEAGPFLCILNPDEYDKRFGKFLEFKVLYDDEEEYFKVKEFAISSGRWAELVRQELHQQTQSICQQNEDNVA